MRRRKPTTYLKSTTPYFNRGGKKTEAELLTRNSCRYCGLKPKHTDSYGISERCYDCEYASYKDAWSHRSHIWTDQRRLTTGVQSG